MNKKSELKTLTFMLLTSYLFHSHNYVHILQAFLQSHPLLYKSTLSRLAVEKSKLQKRFSWNKQNQSLGAGYPCLTKIRVHKGTSHSSQIKKVVTQFLHIKQLLPVWYYRGS